ncbi:MAG: ABC transporter permease [Spirochaetaceae bacterium]|nr:ABC transporter permease [Spirochaetaceae bacterium]
MAALVTYIGRRLLAYFLTVIIAISANFFIPRMIPGDPISALIDQMAQHGEVVSGGAEIVAAYKEQFGLDGTWMEQYFRYLWSLLRGDLGPSIMAFPTTVQELLVTALPWTMGLLLVATVISWVLGNLLGAIVGWRRESKINSAIVVVSLGLNQIPYYFVALLLVFFFSYNLSVFPSSGGFSLIGGRPEGWKLVWDIIYHATLPALSIVIASIGLWVITMRSMILTTLGEDYILLAEAKGLKRSMILTKYALRNALLPQAAAFGIALGFVMNGSILTETIFNYPGLGALLLSAIGNLDYNLLQGILLLTILSVLTANLILEVLYPIIDPRISHGGD